MKRSILIAVVLGLVLVSQAGAVLTFPDLWFVGKGYVSRPCGFDLDDDGVIGEPEDCVICNDTQGTTQVLERFDASPNFAVQTYVDSEAGYDVPLCGGPESPCLTVSYAYDNRMREGEGENIICIHGEFHESFEEIGKDGPPGIWTKPRSGNEVFDWEYATNPNMVVGWDHDADGEYPPFDKDDLAVFDGFEDGTYLPIFLTMNVTPGGADWRTNDDHNTERWEFAHFAVREFGIDPALADDLGASQGMFHTSNIQPDQHTEHVYIHDIKGYHNLYGQSAHSFANMLLELWGLRPYYVNVDNVSCVDCCGYALRGSGYPDMNEASPLRVKNTSLSWFCDGYPEKHYGTPGVKMWGTFTGIEFIDNLWQQSVLPWYDPNNPSSPGGNIFSINTCVEDFYAVGNVLFNTPTAFVVEGGLLRGCTKRNAKNINFLRNVVINDDDHRNLIGATTNLSFNDPEHTTESVTIANNVFLDLGSVPNFRRCFNANHDSVEGGIDPSEMPVAFVGNTCYASVGGRGTSNAWLTFSAKGDQSHRYIIKGNTFAQDGDGSLSSGFWAMRWYTPAIDNVEMDYNIYEGPWYESISENQNKYFWTPNDGRFGTLKEFSDITGYETHGRGRGQNDCKVEFVDRASGNVRLAETDTCAQDMGVDLSEFTQEDLFETPRPQGAGWDIGAHEYTSVIPQPVGTCCDDGCSITTEAECAGVWDDDGLSCTPDPCYVEPPPEPRIVFEAKVKEGELMRVCLEPQGEVAQCFEPSEVAVSIEDE